MKEIVSLIFMGLCASLFAQPSTEVYLFDFHKKENEYQIENPINVSANPGYDNQPTFWPDGQSILYARTVEGQTEIARYFIQTKQTEIITNTLEGSEYSPTPTPDGRVSSIRLDTTGLQRLYSYTLDGKSTVLVTDLVIGYHTWINNDQIVTFVLGEPVTMQMIDVNNQQITIIADSIGRSLHKIPNADAFSYVDKSSAIWTINRMKLDGTTSSAITTALEGSEDYCWTMNGEIIMGKGQELWMWNNSKWILIADLARFNLKGITRIAISPDNRYLAVVVNQ